MKDKILKLPKKTLYSLLDVSHAYPIDTDKFNDMTSALGIDVSVSEFNKIIYDDSAATLDTLPQSIIDELNAISCQLSPENLSWDGERSVSEQREAADKLYKQWFRYEMAWKFIMDLEDFECWLYKKETM